MERDRAKADLEQAKAILQEKDRALLVAARELDALKAEMAAKVVKAQVDTDQEYENNFKDTVDYLYLMRDAVNEYKEPIKKVNPSFNGDYYDRLIYGEPATPALEDLVETPEDKAEQDVAPFVEPEQENAPDQQPVQPAH